MDTTKSVRGTFDHPDGVARAIRGLLARSVPADEMSVWLLDASGSPERRLDVEHEPGVLRGAIWGAGLGAIAAFLLVLAGVVGFLEPVRADVLGLRSLGGALRAILAGAASGFPIGAVLGMGQWRARAHIDESEMGPGRSALVTVDTEELADTARSVLHSAGASTVAG